MRHKVGRKALKEISMSDIVMYGAEWCGDCRRSKRVLNDLGVDYTYVNLEETPEATSTVIEINGGAQSIPVIVFPDGSHMTEPGDLELIAKLNELGISS